MRFVRCNHVLGLRLDVERVLEHVEDEGEVDIAEVVEVLPLRGVGAPEVVVVQIAVVPGLVRVCSCSQEEQVPELGDRLLTDGGQVPLIEDVHEQIEVLKADGGIEITRHIVASPEGVKIIVIDRICPVLFIVDVSSEFLDDRAFVEGKQICLGHKSELLRDFSLFRLL